MNFATKAGILGLIILAGLVMAAASRGDIVDRLLPLVKLAESSGDPEAIGNGSYGLYQITSVLLDHFNQVCRTEYTVADLFDPAINEEIARWYLGWINSYLTRKGYPNDIPRIIYCFNTGVGKLRENGFQIPAWCLHHPNHIYRKIYREGRVCTSSRTATR